MHDARGGLQFSCRHMHPTVPRGACQRWRADPACNAQLGPPVFVTVDHHGWVRSRSEARTRLLTPAAPSSSPATVSPSGTSRTWCVGCRRARADLVQFTGWKDPALTELGEQEALKGAGELKKHGYVSTMEC